jgi:wobble nucleotide-excising tRNase
VNLNNIAEKLNLWIDSVIGKLDEKNRNPFSAVNLSDKPDDFFTSYKSEMENLNKIIEEHNKKCDNHFQEVKNAKEKLELHAIAVAIKKEGYKKKEKELIDAINEEQKLQQDLVGYEQKISELEDKISSVSKAMKEINKHIKEFFGREEIQLELSGNKKGYLIKRDGNPAHNLSESEKTAIAFSYFIVKTNEKKFNINEGVIFIDDPISSLDANFIYHIFSLIKHHFREAGQLFISTHNFQLFNLIKEWFTSKNKRTEEKDKTKKDTYKKTRPCEFYMIKNSLDSGKRQAEIIALDKTLKNFKSEYHFLFSLLNEFNNEEPSYADFYTIGNIARRFFDIFIDFKIPNSVDQKQKLETLVREINKNGEKINNINESKVYKLLNDFSHNSDPISAIEHKDKSESREAIKILLDIIEKADPMHSSLLRASDGK